MPKSNKSIKDDEFEQNLKILILNSIKIQSRSDVEVGSMLSGGVDSSLLQAYLQRILIKKLKLFV